MADGPPEWLRSRVRILRKKSSPRSAPLTPYRLELVFGGFQLDHFDEDRLDLLLRWLRASKGLVQQGLVAVNGNSLGSSLSLLCWADFRGSNLQDTGLEKLLKSLAALPLNMERLYLAQNSITSRSAAALKDFVQVAEGLATLDLSQNSLEDASCFALLSSFPLDVSATHIVSVFLAENLIRNPPALIERLRRASRVVLLDEVLSDLAEVKEKSEKSCKLHLPFFCFQRSVKSELPIGAPSLKKRELGESPDMQPLKNMVKRFASVEVDSAIQSLKSLLPEPVKTLDVDETSTASFLAQMNSFMRNLDLSTPTPAETPAVPDEQVAPDPAEEMATAMQVATPKIASQAIPPEHAAPMAPQMAVPQQMPAPQAMPQPMQSAPPTPVSQTSQTLPVPQMSQMPPGVQMPPPTPPPPLVQVRPGMQQPSPPAASHTIAASQAAQMAPVMMVPPRMPAPPGMPAAQTTQMAQPMQSAPPTPVSQTSQTLPVPQMNQMPPGVQMPPPTPPPPLVQVRPGMQQPSPPAASHTIAASQAAQMAPVMMVPPRMPAPPGMPAAQTTQMAQPLQRAPLTSVSQTSQTLPVPQMNQMPPGVQMPPPISVASTLPAQTLHSTAGIFASPTATAQPAIVGTKSIRPPAPPAPPPPPGGDTKPKSPRKASVLAEYEAALLGETGDGDVEAPWKSQRRRARRTS